MSFPYREWWRQSWLQAKKVKSLWWLGALAAGIDWLSLLFSSEFISFVDRLSRLKWSALSAVFGPQLLMVYAIGVLLFSIILVGVVMITRAGLLNAIKEGLGETKPHMWSNVKYGWLNVVKMLIVSAVLFVPLIILAVFYILSVQNLIGWGITLSVFLLVIYTMLMRLVIFNVYGYLFWDNLGWWAALVSGTKLAVRYWKETLSVGVIRLAINMVGTVVAMVALLLVLLPFGFVFFVLTMAGMTGVAGVILWLGIISGVVAAYFISGWKVCLDFACGMRSYKQFRNDVNK
jgi:hypothetical protein